MAPTAGEAIRSEIARTSNLRALARRLAESDDPREIEGWRRNLYRWSEPKDPPVEPTPEQAKRIADVLGVTVEDPPPKPVAARRRAATLADLHRVNQEALENQRHLLVLVEQIADGQDALIQTAEHLQVQVDALVSELLDGGSESGRDRRAG